MLEFPTSSLCSPALCGEVRNCAWENCVWELGTAAPEHNLPVGMFAHLGAGGSKPLAAAFDDCVITSS